VAFDDDSVADGAYRFTRLAVQDQDLVSVILMVAVLMVAPVRVDSGIGKLMKVCDQICPGLPTCIRPYGSGVFFQKLVLGKCLATEAHPLFLEPAEDQVNVGSM
jgi:hypothetical protein